MSRFIDLSEVEAQAEEEPSDEFEGVSDDELFDMIDNELKGIT